MRIQQHGLSMIELLVALVISSFLIIGITQIYIDNKRNYIFQQSQATNLDNSRFANFLLDEVISKAGYRRSPDQSMLDAYPFSTELSDHCEAFEAEAVITKVKPSNDQTGFCLRYQPAMAGESICHGGSTTLVKETPFTYPNRDEIIYVAVKFTPGNDSLSEGVLSCFGKNSSADLIDGIADFQVEFGSGLLDEKRLKSSPFKHAEDWGNSDGIVRAIRYSILSASRDNQRDGDSQVFSQWLNDATNAARTRLQGQDRRNIYQAAVGAQSVRNMMP